MKASYKLLDVDKMEATLTVTMNVAQWKIVMNKLDKGGYNRISDEFRKLIFELVEHSHKEYEMVVKVTGE